MGLFTKSTIEVKVQVNQPINKVWDFFTQEEHILQWHCPNNEWSCCSVKNDFVKGGRFSYIMKTNDQIMSNTLEGIYTNIELYKQISYKLGDGRDVKINFKNRVSGIVDIIQIIEPEKINPKELQRGGWQALLDSFKKYAEK